MNNKNTDLERAAERPFIIMDDYQAFLERREGFREFLRRLRSVTTQEEKETALYRRMMATAQRMSLSLDADIRRAEFGNTSYSLTPSGEEIVRQGELDLSVQSDHTDRKERK